MNLNKRRGQSMGYWLNEPTILRPERFDGAIRELSEAGYSFLRVMLRATNFTHRSPEVVAAIVRRAADRGGPVVYAPARWRLIMAIIRSIPAAIFNKMNF